MAELPLILSTRPPLASSSDSLHDFRKMADGALVGFDYTNSSQAVVSGKLKATPTYGAELFSNGDFATDTVWNKGAGYVISGGVAQHTGSTTGNLTQSVALSLNSWARIGFDLSNNLTGGNLFSYTGVNGSEFFSACPDGSYAVVARITSTTVAGFRASGSDASIIDNASCKVPVLSDLFTTKDYGYRSYTGQVHGKMKNGSPFGIVSHLDSYTNPQNFIIAYYQGRRLIVDKCVNGTYTTLVSLTFGTAFHLQPFSVYLSAQRTTAGLTVFCNFSNGGGAQTITGNTSVTITDATIIDNTRHGIFNSDNLNEIYSLTMNATPDPTIKQYHLYDRFTTARAAGSVNGTSAEPVGGVRTVTDTSNKISLSGGVVSIATGSATTDNVFYTTYARVPGRACLAEINLTNNTNIGIGWSGVAGQVRDGFLGTGSFRANGVGVVVMPTFQSIPSTVAVIMRQSGAFYFVKNSYTGNQWHLLYANTLSTFNPMAPTILTGATTTVGTVDNLRVPKTLYIPTPLFSDGFSSTTSDGRGSPESGPVGGTWIGSTWANTGGNAVNTPVTFGAEKVTNTGFEGTFSGGLAPNWLSLTGTATESADAHGGSKAQQFQSTAAGGRVYQDVAVTNHKYYLMSAWVKRVSGTAGDIFTGMSNGVTETLTDAVTASSYTQVFVTERARGATMNVRALRGTSVSSDVALVDDVSVTELSIPELIRVTDAGSSDFVIVMKATAARGLHYGIAANVDNPANPQNFVLLVMEGNAVRLLKCVAGVFTEVASAALGRTNGAETILTKSGTEYHAIHNSVALTTNAGSTIADAGIVSNTYHGIFSTHSSITFDNFVVWPRSGSNYSTLDTL